MVFVSAQTFYHRSCNSSASQPNELIFVGLLHSNFIHFKRQISGNLKNQSDLILFRGAFLPSLYAARFRHLISILLDDSTTTPPPRPAHRSSLAVNEVPFCLI